MKTIDIAKTLSPDLKSRVRVDDLKLLIENSNEDSVVLDFQGVQFATRSFIDELYNQFLKQPDALPYKVKLTNVPEDIMILLEAVSHTQIRAKIVSSKTKEVSFRDVNDFLNFLGGIAG